MKNLLSWDRSYNDPLNFPESPTRNGSAGWEISTLIDMDRRACVIAAGRPGVYDSPIPFCELLVQPPAADAETHFTVQDVIDRIVSTSGDRPGWGLGAFQPVVIPLGGDENVSMWLAGLERINKVNDRRFYDLACELRASFHAAYHADNTRCFRLLASLDTDKYPPLFNLVAGFGVAPTLGDMLVPLCEHMTAQVKAYQPGGRYLATIADPYSFEGNDIETLPDLVRRAQSKAASKAVKNYITALIRATKRTAPGRVRERLKTIEQQIDGASAG